MIIREVVNRILEITQDTYSDADRHIKVTDIITDVSRQVQLEVWAEVGQKLIKYLEQD